MPVTQAIVELLPHRYPQIICWLSRQQQTSGNGTRRRLDTCGGAPHNDMAVVAEVSQHNALIWHNY